MSSKTKRKPTNKISAKINLKSKLKMKKNKNKPKMPKLNYLKKSTPKLTKLVTSSMNLSRSTTTKIKTSLSKHGVKSQTSRSLTKEADLITIKSWKLSEVITLKEAKRSLATEVTF